MSFRPLDAPLRISGVSQYISAGLMPNDVVDQDITEDFGDSDDLAAIYFVDAVEEGVGEIAGSWVLLGDLISLLCDKFGYVALVVVDGVADAVDARE